MTQEQIDAAAARFEVSIEEYRYPSRFGSGPERAIFVKIAGGHLILAAPAGGPEHDHLPAIAAAILRRAAARLDLIAHAPPPTVEGLPPGAAMSGRTVTLP